MIRVIYEQEPKFPATDQHPDAVRYKIGSLWVDAMGGKPTQAEVDAILNPSPVVGPRDPFAEINALKTILKSAKSFGDLATIQIDDEQAAKSI